MSENYNIFFDIGSSKIRAAAFNKNSKSEPISFEKNCISSLKKNNLNINNLNNNLEELILNLEKKTNEYIQTANILIDTVDLLNIRLSISKKSDNKKLTKNEIESLVFSAKQQVTKYNKDLEILHILITNFKIDEKNFSTIQLGEEYKLLSLDILFICFPKNIINKINNLFKKNHISIQNYFSSCYAKTNTYKDKFTSFENIVFVELGYDKTSIITYKNQSLVSFNLIPIGGNHITRDISKILKISDEESENIKKEFNDKNLISENFNTQKELLKNLSQNTLTHEELSLMVKEIIFARIDEILNLSFSIVSDLEFNKNKQYKIILIGSGSKIFENNSINISQNINLFDDFEYFKEDSKIICQSGENLLLGKNPQEVSMVEKQNDIPGFFVRFFNIFK